jgi:hypothetical protein
MLSLFARFLRKLQGLMLALKQCISSYHHMGYGSQPGVEGQASTRPSGVRFASPSASPADSWKLAFTPPPVSLGENVNQQIVNQHKRRINIMAIARKITNTAALEASASSVTHNGRRVLEDATTQADAGTQVLLKDKGITSVRSQNKFGGNLLSQELFSCFEPLVKALDDRPALLQEASADNGQEMPSVLDSAMRYEISNMLSNLYRQNYGTITIQKKDPKTGRPTGATTTLPNGKERLDASLMKVNEMTEVSTNEDFAALHWLKVNEARFDTRNNLMSAIQAVYEEIFHESWKSVEQAPITKAAAKDIPQEEKDRALAELQRVRNRMRS